MERNLIKKARLELREIISVISHSLYNYTFVYYHWDAYRFNFREFIRDTWRYYRLQRKLFQLIEADRRLAELELIVNPEIGSHKKR